jgi:nitrite reductase (NO-forming)
VEVFDLTLGTTFMSDVHEIQRLLEVDAVSNCSATASWNADAAEDRSTNRRGFLTRLSALGLTLPGVGAALTSCSRSAPNAADTTRHDSTGATASTTNQQPPARGVRNPDSRLDTVHHLEHRTMTTPTGAANAVYQPFDPTVPPLPKERTQKIHWRAREAPVRISPDLVVAAWTFEGNLPGPTVRCRVGDTIDFTLTNEHEVPHSMDFHAAQIDPKTAFRSVLKGQSVSYSFQPRYAGAFCYHCGSSPVLMHIGSGMVGAIIVDPPTPLPRAKEFVLVQNEFYLANPVNGVHPFDYTKMLSTLPDYVAFNGRPGQYQTEPLRVKRGDRVRFYVVTAGPTVPCAFHIVGEQFDTVYIGAPPGNAIHGVQTFNVAAGGGMIFEFVANVAGEFPFVNHGFGHGQKGAIGVLVVEE